MLRRHEQVLLTYVRQWQFWAYVGSWTLVVGLLGFLPPWLRGEPILYVFVALAATGPAGVIGHAKQQIADARATTIPGFRAPHVVVAVALSLAALLLLPLMTYRSLHVGFPLLILTVMIAVASIPFAMIAYFQSVTAVLVAIAGVSVMMPFLDTLFLLFHHFPVLPPVTLLLALATFAALFYRLATLREGMSEYGRVLGRRGGDDGWSHQRKAAPGQGTFQPSLPARVQRFATERRLRSLRNVFAAGVWTRVRHWMISAEMSGTKPVAAALLAAMLTGIPLLTGQSRGDPPVVAIAAVTGVLMPLFCITVTWMPRRRALGYELMRPASRQRFVGEFGLAMARDLAEWWMWLTAAALLPVLVWGPPLPLPHVLAMLVLSAAEQVLAFGILVSVLRVRSPHASDNSIMMSVVAVVLPIMGAITIPRTPGTTLAIAVGVAALGAALTYDAYRRWCEADLA